MMKKLIISLLSAALLFAAIPATADGPGIPGTYDPPVIEPPAPSYSFVGPYAGLSFSQTEVTNQDTVRSSETTQTSEEVPVMDQCPYTSGHSGGGKCTFPDGIAENEFPGIGMCNRDYSATCIIRTNDDGTDYVFVKGGAKGGAYTYDTGETTTVMGPSVTTYFTETIRQFAEKGTAGGFVGYGFDLGGNAIGRIQTGTDGSMTTAELQAGIQMGRALPHLIAGLAHYDDDGGFDFTGDNGAVIGAGIDYLATPQTVIGGRCTVGRFDAGADVDDTETQTCGVHIAMQF